MAGLFEPKNEPAGALQVKGGRAQIKNLKGGDYYDKNYDYWRW